MKKGLSPIVSAILILLIAISVTLLAIIWLPRFISNIFPPEETELNNSYIMSRSCLSIENIDSINNILTLKNCGKTSLQGFTFYIDGQTTVLQLDKLDPQESADIAYGHIIKGNHNFYITADYAETSIINFYEIGACDFYIAQSNMTNTYPISQSNKVYCLAENISIIGQTAIIFNPGVQNTILDCQNYNIEGRGSDASGTHGIYMTGVTTKNNMITDCTVTNFYDGLYVEYSTNNVFSYNTFNSNYYGIRFFGAGNNSLNNIIADSNNNGLEIDSGDYNNFEGITANSNTVEGLYFGSSSNNDIEDVEADYNNDGLNINATSINNAFFNVNANYNDIYGFFLNGTSGNNLNYINASYDSYGLYLLQASNNNIVNSVAMDNVVGAIYLSNSSSNTIASNTVSTNPGDGIHLESSSNNILSDNIANYNGIGLILHVKSDYNTLTNNIVSGNAYGIDLDSLDSGSNNAIRGGSVHDNAQSDYGFVSSGTTDNFTNTNFTSLRTLYFKFSSCWFNYQNDSTQRIWLKTSVSDSQITRKLINWNQTLINWNDTPSASVIARYNITGLLPNQQYKVYNKSAGVQTNPYTLTTDGNGALNFTINLTSSTEVLVNVSSVIVPTAPVYSLNSTNSTLAGSPIMHRLYWQDTYGLSGYIFQFCNGTWTGSSCLGSPSNWLSGWQYRKQHNIISAGGAGVNYTININVINGIGTDSGNTVYINNKARSDFGDIRFTNSSNNLLNYWMESVNNGVNATFWVQISGDLTSTNQSIYIYYGNSTMTNLSNGNKTFNLFDDFLGSSLDLSKWQVYSTGESYSVSSSQLVLSYSTDYKWLRVQSISAFNSSYAFRMRFHSTDVSNYNKPIYLEWMDSTTGEGESGVTYFGFYKNDYQDRFWRAYDGTATESYDMGVADTNWHIIDVDRASDDLAKCYYDNNFEKDFTTSVTGGNKIIGMKVGNSAWGLYNAIYNVSIDWVAVRKYVYPEPSQGSWGSEEAQTSVGGWWNDTWNSTNFDGLTSAWSNVTKVVNSTVNAKIAWCVYANDTFNHWNWTSCVNPFVYVVTGGVTPFQIDFVSPTPSDGNVTSNNFAYANVSIVNSLNTSSFIDWNRSLVGYWAMDWYNSTGVFDNSTYNNFGNFTGGLAINNITAGQYGKGLSFDGVNDYVNISDNPTAFNITNEMTISAWVYALTNQSIGGSNQIIDRLNYATSQGFWLREGYNQSHNFEFDVGNGTNSTGNCGSNCWMKAFTGWYSPNNWYYVTGTVKANDKIRIYVNGILKSENNFLGTINQTTGPIRIGYEGSGRAFNGTIDEVQIWNRVLSPEEINASYNSSIYRLYHNFTGLSNGVYQYYAYAIDTAGNANKTLTRSVTSSPPSSSPPILWFKFNEANGTKTYDSSGNGFVGTFGGESFNNGISYSGSTPTNLHNSSGKYGHALSFDGVNDFVNVPDSNSLDVGNITITAWINPLAFGDYGRIVDKGNYAFLIANDTNSRTLSFYYTNSTGNWTQYWSNHNAVVLNTWQFVAVTYNGTHVTFYNNGIFNGTTATSCRGPIEGSTSNLCIGSNCSKESDGYTRAFKGTIDEVRIWNRSLSQAEIQAEMSSSLPTTEPAASWSFEEPSAATYVNDTHIWVNGTYGSALAFNGNDAVNVSNIPNSSLTVMAWIYPTQIFGDERAIACKWGSNSEWILRLSNETTARLQFYIINLTGGWEEVDSTPADINVNNWYHVAAVYDRPNKMMSFYVNGVANGTGYFPYNGQTQNITGIVMIGEQSGGSYDPFYGKIDEVKIWNRTLTQAEIQTAMNTP